MSEGRSVYVHVDAWSTADQGPADRGIDVGLIAVAYRIRYAQIAVVASTEKLSGVQAGLLYSSCAFKRPNLPALQCAGVYATSRSGMTIQGAALIAISGESTAVQAAGVYACAHDVGVQLSGLAAEASRVSRVQAAVFAESARVDKGALQGALLYASCRNLQGLQIAPIAKATRKSTGIQVGLFLYGPGQAWWNPSFFYQRLKEPHQGEGTLDRILDVLFSART